MKNKTIVIAAAAAGALLLASRANAATADGGAASGGGVFSGLGGGSGGGGAVTGSAGGSNPLQAAVNALTGIVSGILGAFGGGGSAGSGDPLADAYLSGDFAKLNTLLASGNITAGMAAERYGLPDSSLVTMRNAGVVFAPDPVQNTASVDAAAASTAPAIDWTPVYRAYETSDYATLNRELQAQGISAGEAAEQYSLSDAMLQQMQANGIVFATT